MPNVAVLDIGKTNIKLSAASPDGAILETLSTANTTLAGPPYRHPDLDGIETWFLGEFGPLARRHGIASVVTCSHGSAGVLVGEDGPLLPMLDYEQDVPSDLNAAYLAEADALEERGAPVMAGAAHMARQLFWIEHEWPDRLTHARFFLGAPQYWAWRLTGVAASEVTYLGAQSHLWNIPGRRFCGIVERRGWERLIPELRPAWARLGPIRADLAQRFGLPNGMEVLCGIHDSSANFYRYQQAGLSDLAVISTGTWIVGLSDSFAPDRLARTGGMTWNADVQGNPLTGMLAMGGREFAAIAGPGADRAAGVTAAARVVQAGTMALPTFAFDDGPFPGSAGRGRIVGPQPDGAEERRALATLYVALVTDACLDRMGGSATVVLDGSFVTDPLYTSLVGALRPATRTLVSADAYGTAAGAAMLAGHSGAREPAGAALENAQPIVLPGLEAYRGRWRELTAGSRAATPAAREQA